MKRMTKEEVEAKMAADRAQWEELKKRLMEEEHLDDDGYPTDAALELIEKWYWDDCTGLLEFIKSIWHMRSWGWTEVNANELDKDDDDYDERGGKLLFVSTAGWSGNESIIRAFKENHMAWMLCWVQSRRGGHFIFEPHQFKDDQGVQE
jgi:hypothetical protein